ncbi:uncharacterized protein LOC129764352 [Toxorhynchites rutilus septentrionalis]|uniref:uncharacterized protein LOC129764352 n=1 Tax=Toxorhynchites rutilus septentrionalis TaxID=329112 RepID=UPI0024796E01|nr:uncharacterized protein LOC129764352 [Toxorhynchites rutilus septentrionalis]
MTKLGSFVFFDLETTDLPGLKTPKITEIALVACSKKHLLDTKAGEVPRVLHKQTFCVNPRRVIHPKASETTGLYNDLLEHEDTFNRDAAKLIVLFLERLQTPICLVAHNGNRFDFIILKHELEAHKIELPHSVYCVDSLQLFRQLEGHKEQKEKYELADLESKTLSAMEELECNQHKLSEMQKLNETTPHKPQNKAHRKRVSEDNLDVTPSHVGHDSVSRGQRSPPRSKRELFPDKSDTLEPSIASTSSQKFSKKFRLCDIYERYFGKPPKKGHHAEGDVKALLKCAIADGRAFVEYAEKYCVKMSNISSRF